MNQSLLQKAFLRELAQTFVSTQQRISKRLSELEAKNPSTCDDILRDELRGLYHGLLVIFDGGSALADEGLIRIVDENGMPFDRHLHEICFDYWPGAKQASNDRE